MLFFEHPPEGATIVREHLADSLVTHLLVVEFLFEKFVLVSDFLFTPHGCENRRPQQKPVDSTALLVSSVFSPNQRYDSVFRAVSGCRRSSVHSNAGCSAK